MFDVPIESSDFTLLYFHWMKFMPTRLKMESPNSSGLLVNLTDLVVTNAWFEVVLMLQDLLSTYNMLTSWQGAVTGEL